MTDLRNIPDSDLIFAMDIGTRSIIGMVGVMDGDKLRILEIEKEPHVKRAMLDGQIEDIGAVASVGRIVKERLESRLGRKLTRVCIAAAGRALKTQRASSELRFPEPTRLDEEIIGRLENGALSKAEAEFRRSMGPDAGKFFLVSHTVAEYQVDGYPMSNLLDHKGQVIQAQVVATFLPSEVVNSLYAAMRLINLRVASVTLEPIAAINAVIPANLRLLNLALVDIGAGTSDIAVSRDGGVVGYTMATVAGDEITEALMRAFLLSFESAEQVKMSLDRDGDIAVTNILGQPLTLTAQAVEDAITPARQALCEEIAHRIADVNGGKAPSAVFLAGGGGKLSGMCRGVAQALAMDENRVAVAGQNFEQSAFSDNYILNDAEYATPLGIAISAGFNLIGDSYRVMLNGASAKLFRNGTLTVQELLTMNGCSIQDFLPRNGRNIMVQVNGRREIFRGETGRPAVLTLNGEKARLTNIVRAGDEIEFTPATRGEDAHVTAGEAIRSDTLMVTVNGEAVSPSRPLEDGDVVCSETPEPAAPEAPAPELPMVDDDAYALPQLPHSEDGGEFSAPEENPGDAPPRLIAAEPEEDDSPRNTGIRVTFNGDDRFFPPKEDGEPYYLMNFLKYCEFSLEHPDGNVSLTLNGKPGSFLNVVHSGDRVDILCAERDSL
jgi:cell division protein FtsA